MIETSGSNLKGNYCNSLTEYSRYLTREVLIGDIALGAENPIRIQSMTTTDTMNTIATVEQTIRMVDAGCEYVRITAPSVKEAQNLAEIKKELRKRGYNVPLIADIHFTPNAAEVAARVVEKVRINPGNYADKKRFDQLEYTPSQYQAELERIYSKFTPLVKVCKEYGTAMRIGTNHGSLSDRIMSYYGDTPRGMVESAMEFIRMCESLNYYNLVISMKSSNPQVMVQAYRMLVETMALEGMNYPLHLGVTEAGDGEDGRIKSAVGIGTLLEDGLGDTIRVSLTEEPEFEAPVAKALAERYERRAMIVKGTIENKDAGTKKQDAEITKMKSESSKPIVESNYNPYEYKKRQSAELNTFIGGHQVPRVIVDMSRENLKDPDVLAGAGYVYSLLLDKYNIGDQSVDFVYLADELPSFTMPGNLKQLYNYSTWKGLLHKKNCHPLFSLKQFVSADSKDPSLNLIQLSYPDVNTEDFRNLVVDNSVVFVIETNSEHGMAEQRSFFLSLYKLGINPPVIIRRKYPKNEFASVAVEENIWSKPRNQVELKVKTSEMLHTPSPKSIYTTEVLADIAAKSIYMSEKPVEITAEAIDKSEKSITIAAKYIDTDSKDIDAKVKDAELAEIRPESSESELISSAISNLQLYAATDCGALLVDGFGDGIWIDAPEVPLKSIVSTSFGILQATRSRISKTEYISCPSCGRTLFDLQETTQMIRSKTDHLKGLKIGIMGCIVNGPGEMADADYGYVGTGPGKITLYRGKEVVKKNVNAENALNELIEIIREDGNWIEPTISE